MYLIFLHYLVTKLFIFFIINSVQFHAFISLILNDFLQIEPWILSVRLMGYNLIYGSKHIWQNTSLKGYVGFWEEGANVLLPLTSYKYN